MRHPIAAHSRAKCEFVRDVAVNPHSLDYTRSCFSSIATSAEEAIGRGSTAPTSPLYARLYSLPENAHTKNRYLSIFPFDYNIVPILDSPDGSYINASAIALPLRNHSSRDCAYIATQGPMTNTMMDFWRMVYQRDARLIVCLAQKVEDGRPKFDKYWSEDKSIDVPLLSGAALRVSHIDTETWTEDLPRLISSLSAASTTSVATAGNRVLPAFLRNLIIGPRYKEHSSSLEVFSCLEHITLRRFHIVYLPADKTRPIKNEVYQLCTSAWPDFGTMQVDHFLAFMEISRYINISLKNPIVVHCSAGVGRTGTFIAADFITRYLEDSIKHADFNCIDDIVYATVADLRRQRVMMVSTVQQYQKIYEYVHYYLVGIGLMK